MLPKLFKSSTPRSRFKLPILIVVYNDGFAGAEAHHYGPLGYDLDIVTFQDTDFAGIGKAFGMPPITVRTPEDLAPVEGWSKAMNGPMVIDAKIDKSLCAGWLEEAFRNSDHPVKHTTKHG